MFNGKTCGLGMVANLLYYTQAVTLFKLTSCACSFEHMTDSITLHESHGYIILDADQGGKREETELPCFSCHP